MRSVKTLLLLLIVACIIATAIPASAYKGEYFNVSGRVTDANWNPIPGAYIELYDFDFNLITTQNTTAQGYFSFEGVSVTSNVFNIRVTYTDENGTAHKIPGYYIPAMTAKGDIKIESAKTRFDDYYLPGSQPLVSPTPVPTATPVPTVAPTPVPESGDSAVIYVLLFAGGFIAGASLATLACFLFMGRKKR
jgi:hypothetical protein